MYAGTYPDQIVGMVSLDGSLPTDDQVDQLIPKDERGQAMAEQEANQERVEFYRTVDEAKLLVAKVPDVPVTTWPPGRSSCPQTGRSSGCAPSSPPSRPASPRPSPKGRLVEVRSSHDIDLEEPELVIEEINRILKTA